MNLGKTIKSRSASNHAAPSPVAVSQRRKRGTLEMFDLSLADMQLLLDQYFIPDNQEKTKLCWRQPDCMMPDYDILPSQNICKILRECAHWKVAQLNPHYFICCALHLKLRCVNLLLNYVYGIEANQSKLAAVNSPLQSMLVGYVGDQLTYLYEEVGMPLGLLSFSPTEKYHEILGRHSSPTVPRSCLFSLRSSYSLATLWAASTRASWSLRRLAGSWLRLEGLSPRQVCNWPCRLIRGQSETCLRPETGSKEVSQEITYQAVDGHQEDWKLGKISQMKAIVDSSLVDSMLICECTLFKSTCKMTCLSEMKTFDNLDLFIQQSGLSNLQDLHACYQEVISKFDDCIKEEIKVALEANETGNSEVAALSVA
eukprot:756942-Hanusia_phi.AAC.1